MFDNMFNKEDNTNVAEMENSVKEFDDIRIDLTLPIQKPCHFDELKGLIDCYEDMEIIIDSLKKSTCQLQIDENPDDKGAEFYKLDKEYVDLFVDVLKGKMKEIRNILNYN